MKGAYFAGINTSTRATEQPYPAAKASEEPRRHQLEKQVGATTVHGEVPKLVDHQKVESAEEVQHFAEGV